MISRRQFLKNTTLAAGAFALSASPFAVNSFAQSPAKKFPNIVIIFADDMGYGDIACQNPQSKIPTPNLDKLASQGARFTDAHSSASICSPSRYALLSGQYHWRRLTDIVNSFEPSPFKPDQLTMPKMLQQKGYFTGAIGKWHLGWNWDAVKNTEIKKIPKKQRTAKKQKGLGPDAFDWTKRIPGGPCDIGFNTYFGDDTINFPPYAWFENDRIPVPPTVPLDLGDKKTAEGVWEFRPGPMVEGWDPFKVLPTLTKRGVEWIGQQKKDKPFFLYFALPSPHAPIIPNEEFVGKSKANGYGDWMVESDWAAGQIINAIKEKGFEDNTIVIFSSDNGPEKYAFERVRKFDHRSMGQLRGLKRDLWEGGHRIPFVVRWPGVIKPGRVSDVLISQVDLMATFASLTGFDLPKTAAEDSYDMLPALKDNTDKTRPRHVHVHNTPANKFAIRKDDWVLIDAKTGSVTAMPEWFAKENNYDNNLPAEGGLFNLKEEIGERTNQIDKHPEIAAELRKILNDIRQNGHSAPRFEK